MICFLTISIFLINTKMGFGSESWRLFGNKEYYVDLSSTENYLHAVRSCMVIGSELALLKDEGTARHVVKLIPNMTNFAPPYAFYIGLVRNDDGEFEWLDGSRNARWMVDHPTNQSGRKNHVVVGNLTHYDPTFRPHAVFGEEKAHFICERSAGLIQGRQAASTTTTSTSPGTKDTNFVVLGDEKEGGPYSFYIGLMRNGPTKLDFEWTDGSSVSSGLTWWYVNEPNNVEEYSVIMGWAFELDRKFPWYDVDKLPSRYICQKGVESTTSRPTTMSYAPSATLATDFEAVATPTTGSSYSTHSEAATKTSEIITSKEHETSSPISRATTSKNKSIIFQSTVTQQYEAVTIFPSSATPLHVNEFSTPDTSSQDITEMTSSKYTSESMTSSKPSITANSLMRRTSANILPITTLKAIRRTTQEDGSSTHEDDSKANGDESEIGSPVIFILIVTASIFLAFLVLSTLIFYMKKRKNRKETCFYDPRTGHHNLGIDLEEIPGSDGDWFKNALAPANDLIIS